MKIDKNISKKVSLELIYQTIISMNERFNSLDNRFNQLEDTMNKRFDNIDKRFDNMDKRFDNMDKRFDNIDSRINHLEKRMDKRFDKLEDEIEKVDSKVDGTILDHEGTNERLTKTEDDLKGTMNYMINLIPELITKDHFNEFATLNKLQSLKIK